MPMLTSGLEDFQSLVVGSLLLFSLFFMGGSVDWVEWTYNRHPTFAEIAHVASGSVRAPDRAVRTAQQIAVLDCN